MMGQPLHIADAEAWLAVATEPDLCKVGKCVVAFNSFARLDRKHTASPDVKARGALVYRVGDLFMTTYANAGAHIVCGTSLCSAYVQVLGGHANVKVNALPAARHDSACRINCDSTGMGGARGQIVTMTKTVAPAAAKQASAAPGTLARVSKKLLALKSLRDALMAGRLDPDAFDWTFDFDSANAALDGWIGEIHGTPGTVGDWDAQIGRAALGFTKDFVMGVGELAYEAIKGVPKLALRNTREGRLLARLDEQILAEEISLGNADAPSIARDALGLAKAMARPVSDPWAKGQYVESTMRGGLEVLTFWSGALKAARAAKAKKLLDLAKAKDAAAAAAAGSATTTAALPPSSISAAASAPAAGTVASSTTGSPAVAGTVGSGATASAAKVATAPAVTGGIVVPPAVTSAARGGVYVALAPKRMRPAANGFSGPDGYLTHGIRDSPLRSEEGRKLVASYRAQGIAPDKALKMSRELMASGSTLPKAVDLAAGESLFKIVPEGNMPGPYSAFFATKDEVTALKGMSYDQISDRIGIPLESQQTLRFDVVEVKATKAVTVFESKIAPTTQNGYIQPGGGIQTLITNRSAFTNPTVIGKLP